MDANQYREMDKRMAARDLQAGRKKPVVGFLIIGIILIAYLFYSAGFSFIFVPKAETPEDIEKLFVTSGGYRRPFLEVPFEMVGATTYYLHAADENVPEYWIQYGYFNNCFATFYVKASQPQIGEEGETNLGYILRYPNPGNSASIDQTYFNIISELSENLGYGSEVITELFIDGVFEADRNGVMVYRLAFAAAVVDVVVSLILISGRKKKREAEYDLGGSVAGQSRPEY